MNRLRNLEVGLLKRGFLDIHCLKSRNGASWLMPIHALPKWIKETNLPVPVSFSLVRERNWPRERPLQISLIDAETDIELISECFFADDNELWMLVLEPYLSKLDDKEKAEAIVSKLVKIQDKISESLLISAIKNPELLTLEAIPLFKRIGIKRRWEVLEEAYSRRIPDKIIDSLTNVVSVGFEDKFWNYQPRSPKAVSVAIPFAPKAIRNTLFEEAFAEYLKIASASPARGQISFEAKKIVGELTNKDRELSRLWAKKEDNRANFETNYTRMLSARNAEKAAAQFFKRLGYEVRDIAIQQVTTKGDDWRTHDLLLDGSERVDVKNARPTYNNRNAYAELTIPRFKHDRWGNDVLISGVFSPHQWIWELDSSFPTTNEPWGKHSKKRAEGKLIIILGVTSKRVIDNLEIDFKTQVLNVRVEHTTKDLSNMVRKTIPPWVFDYPEPYYESYQKYLLGIVDLKEEQIPSARVMKAIGRKPPLGLFVAAGRRPPNDCLALLESWQLSYLDQLLSLEERSLPAIFMTILRHFTEAICNSPNRYDPLDYFTLIDCEGYPLGRRDPLESVHNLCKNLRKLWDHREVVKLHEFKRFEFKGLGILKGQRTDNGNLTTLMAYCGGRTKKLVKCGYPDLILGNPDIQECLKCHRLICPQCGYCDQDCPENEPRQCSLGESDDFEQSYGTEWLP